MRHFAELSLEEWEMLKTFIWKNVRYFKKFHISETFRRFLFEEWEMLKMFIWKNARHFKDFS